MTTLKRWCVQNGRKWCAVKGQRPMPGSVSAEMKCGDVVSLPEGVERREPTCKKCLSAVEVVSETPFKKANKPTFKKAQKRRNIA